jgi:hypothetical protein
VHTLRDRKLKIMLFCSDFFSAQYYIFEVLRVRSWPKIADSRTGLTSPIDASAFQRDYVID